MTTEPSTRFTIGAEAHGSDGVCGKVTRVVIDPILRTVTHLVVEPKHRSGLGRLVPLDLLDTTTSEIRLHCTVADFLELDAAEETHFLPGDNAYADYAEGQALYWPYYGSGSGGSSPGTGIGGSSLDTSSMDTTLSASPSNQPITNDILPAGEVGIRRGERVHATDGEIGRVEGAVIEQPGHRITHVLLQEGHLFGRKDVAIPIEAVTGLAKGIQLNLTKKQVEDLPPVATRRPDHHRAEGHS